jgi:Putative transposase/Transposase zinc-binding domain
VTAPRWEVADIIRKVGSLFLDSLTRAQRKVLRAIVRCRTAALGGHRDQCVHCGHQIISFFSCRNRHCPKCQVNARERWLKHRQQELLPVEYFHIVFSVPHDLIPLMWQNKKLLFSLLFQSAGSALLKVAADPKRLGVDIGFLCVLHTWGQTLQRHPHIHCVVPGGGLSLDHSRWISSHPRFFVPVKVVSKEFRDMFLNGLEQAYRAQKLLLYGECQSLADTKVFGAFLEGLKKGWVVFAKPPFGGPEHVLHYLARYVHRVAISNHRIVSIDDASVTFKWKDYAHNSKQCTMTLTHEDFLRRFLQHILPKGLPRVRYFGWLANRRRGHLLPLCRTLLHQNPNPPEIPNKPYIPHCPKCNGEMRIIERLTAVQLWKTLQRMAYVLDTS